MPVMTPAPRRRPLWRLFFMPVLVLVAAVAWSAFWFYAASEVGVRADAWRAQEAKAGRVYDCGNRSVAGFPFRLEVRCDGCQRRAGVADRGRAGAVHRAARRNPGGGADLRSETDDRGVQGAGDDRRSRRPAVADGELEDRPQQRGRPAGGAAARLPRIRGARDRPHQRIDPDAAGARRACRVARKAGRGIHVGEPRDRDRARDQGRQRAGRASGAGRTVRCRRARQADRPEGYLAKAMAAALPRIAGRGRPCRDRAVAHSAGRSGRGCRGHA